MGFAHQNNYSPTHPKANKWLTDFMIDLKKMLYVDTNYQPFTMQRLEEWSVMRDEIEECVDWESSFDKRLTDNLIHEHAAAIMHFNGLVIDLKLMVSNFEYDAITENRIIEADKHYMEVTRCKKHLRIHY